jgi:hypothetical protein
VTRLAAIVAYLLGFAAFAVLEWRARQPDSPVPTLGQVCAYVLDYRVGRVPVGRIAVLGFWWWVGWHFLAR